MCLNTIGIGTLLNQPNQSKFHENSKENRIVKIPHTQMYSHLFYEELSYFTNIEKIKYHL